VRKVPQVEKEGRDDICRQKRWDIMRKKEPVKGGKINMAKSISQGVMPWSLSDE